MGINVEAYRTPAIRGDVSGVAINCAIAISDIADCLEDINNQRHIDPAKIAKIRETATAIQKIFVELTAWTAE